MSSIGLFAPIVLPIAAAAFTAAGGLAGFSVGRAPLAVGMWGAIAGLIAIWVPVRSTQEINLGPLGIGAPLDLRLDAVGFAFCLLVLIPAAILITLQPRTWQEGSVAALGVAASILAIESGGVLLTALAGGTAATLSLIHLDVEDARAPRPSWAMVLAAWLAFSWAGAILQVRGGTAVYGAIPIALVTVPVFALFVAAALMASGLLPWRGWPSPLWLRPSLRAAGLVVATLYPLGFYMLIRAYEQGDGRYPHIGFNIGLAVLGVLVALGAAARAQSAATRREYLAEVIPGLGGFALMGIGLGTALGVGSGILALVMVSLMTACLPLLPDRAGPASLIAIAAAAGLPPGLAFGARVLGIEATFENGDVMGLVGIAAAATWAISMMAAARAIGLPAGRGHAAVETSPRGGIALAAATLLMGPALAVLWIALAVPTQADVMAPTPGLIAGGLVSVVTVSTVLPVLTLFGPLLALGVIAFLAARPVPVRGQQVPPLFALPGTQILERVQRRLRAVSAPEQYRSLLNPRALEAAAASGGPVLWLASLLALALAVTR